MLTIRLQRVGRKNDPSFRVIVVEAARAAKTGHYLELSARMTHAKTALTLKLIASNTGYLWALLSLTRSTIFLSRKK
jgi:hypothetical protein